LLLFKETETEKTILLKKEMRKMQQQHTDKTTGNCSDSDSRSLINNILRLAGIRFHLTDWPISQEITPA